MIDWQPDGEIDAFSGTLSGAGVYALSSFFVYDFNAPTNGLILWRFHLVLEVTSFDSNVIWTANSAAQIQLRGGRILPRGSNTLLEEVYVNRASQRTTEYWFYDADNEESPTLNVGSGFTRVIISPETVGLPFCREVYYGLEPTVTASLSIHGSYMRMPNPGNEITYELNI